MSIPFYAYQGTKPFIFVSYAHKDKNTVYGEIKLLHYEGYRIWYDEGIPPASEWPEEIAKAIEACEFFLVFITPHAVQSKYVLNEIHHALKKNKPFLAIHTEAAILPSGLEMEIGRLQAIMKFQESNQTYYRKVRLALPSSVKETDPSEWLEMGIILLNQGKFAEALEAFEKTLQRAPKIGEAWAKKGYALLKLRKQQDALEALNRALILDKKNIDAWANKGHTLVYLKKFDEAITSYNQSLALKDDNATVWNGKGTALAFKNKSDEALQCFEQAIELEPNYQRAWENKARVLRKLGRAKEAGEASKRAKALKS